LLAYPKVREAAVIGYPDPILGERVCAVIAAQPGPVPDLDELVNYLRDQAGVAAYKLPERLIVVEELPRNPLGKILKRTLRERYNKEGT
jgi:non-ribosomal peptide synthetase component E (peptide arylation enzyme)